MTDILINNPALIIILFSGSAMDLKDFFRSKLLTFWNYVIIFLLQKKKKRKIKTTPNEFIRNKPKSYRAELLIRMIYFHVYDGGKKREIWKCLICGCFILCDECIETEK